MSESVRYGRPPRRAELFGYVQRLWYQAEPAASGYEIKLPTTTAQLLINFGGDRLSSDVLTNTERHAVGPVGLAPIAPGPVVLDRTEQRRIAGVVIRPEAVGALARMPADRLGPMVGLTEVWGSWAERLREAAEPATTGPAVLNRIEEELVSLIRRADCAPADPVTRFAVAELTRSTRIGTISDLVGFSQSAWTRRFAAAVGLTPKRYQRLLRLERAVDLARPGRPPDWAAIAASAGYFDQAHLINDFADLTGFTPARWFTTDLDNPFHVRLRRVFPITPGGRPSES